MSTLTVHLGPRCPLFSYIHWVTAPAPLRESVILQIRTCLSSQPPHQSQDSCQPSSATSTQSDLAFFPGAGACTSVFSPIPELTYPWRSWNFISSQNPVVWLREDTGLCGLKQPGGGLARIEFCCVAKEGGCGCPSGEWRKDPRSAF